MAEILVLSNLSDAALNAADHGVKLFGEEGNSFTLLHTYMDPVPLDPIMISVGPIVARTATEEQQVWQTRFHGLLKNPMGRTHSLVEIGPMSAQVAAMTADHRYAAVVTGLPEDDITWWLGGDEGRVLKASHVPVLAVPSGVKFSGLRRIVVADDGGEVTPAHFTLVLDMAVKFKADIVVLRVVQGDAPAAFADREAMYRLAFAGTPCSFTTVEADDVVAAIDREALRMDADLVVLLHRHLGVLGGLFHISTTKRLALHAHLPLLVLQLG